MRTASLLLALAAALAAGWFGRDLLGGAPAAPPPEAVGTGAPAGGASTGPALAGREPPGGDTLAQEAVRAVRTLERRTGDLGTARVRGLAALATLQAVAGSESEFLRVAAQALAQGASLDELLPALGEFPAEVRARLLVALLDQAGRVPFDVVEVGRMLAEGGQSERALTLVRATLPLQSVPAADLLRLYLHLDPTQGPAALLALESSARWDADTLGVLRALFIEGGQDREIVPFLVRALATRPGDADLLRWLARVDPRAAEERLRVRLQSSPDDARAWSLLADLRRDAGDGSAAFDAYRRAAELDPGRSTFRDLVRADPVRGLELVAGWTQGSQDDERLGALGEMYALAGRKDEALAAYLRAHEHDPADRMWIERSIELDPVATAAMLERQIAAAPAAAGDELLGSYAQALAAAGRRDDAFQQYLAAFQKDPADDEWQSALATTDPRRALPVLEAHVLAHPSDASASGAYGLALEAAGRRDDAIRALDAAMAGGDAGHWFAPLARLDAERALVALDRRARAAANDPRLWGLLGKQLKEQNRGEEARRAFESASRLDPTNRAWAEALRDLR